MAEGIDFMAIARGREAALADNWKDIRRLQEQEQYDLRREQQYREQRDARNTEFATRYLAPLHNYRQQAIAAGMSQADWFANMVSSIQNDPQLRDAPPEALQEIMKQLNNTGAVLAQTSANAGDDKGAAKIYGAMGLSDVLNPMAVAARAGDLDAMAQRVGAKLSEDRKTVTLADGTVMPTSQWFAVTGANPSLGALASITAGANYQIGQDAINRGKEQRAEALAIQVGERDYNRNTQNSLLCAQYGIKYDDKGILVDCTTGKPAAPSSIAALVGGDAATTATDAASVAAGTTTDAASIAAGGAAAATGPTNLPKLIIPGVKEATPQGLEMYKEEFKKVLAQESAKYREAIQRRKALGGLTGVTPAMVAEADALVKAYADRIDSLAASAHGLEENYRGQAVKMRLDDPVARAAAIATANAAKVQRDIDFYNRQKL